jgi:hypothetical protein
MKERPFHWIKRVPWLLALVVVVLSFVGCATTSDSDNLSTRPWNTPKGWENGVPSQMFEGR